MAPLENPDACPICGDPLPEEPPDVTLPARFGPRLTPVAGPAIRRIGFCSERHRRDWLDSYRGEWPDGVFDGGN